MPDRKNYTPLPTTEDDALHVQPRESSASPLRIFILYISVIPCIISLIGFGYLLGSREVAGSKGTWIAPSGTQHYYMHFNASFPQKSGPKTDDLWDSLFPTKLGFVQHPEISPEVAGIAVFHELHCLNILRKAFFASLEGELEEMGAEDVEHNRRTSPHHLRHCFEYLRQSLICLADTNLELMNYTAKGVSGWQTKRTCRDFEKVKSWADDWGITRDEALENFDRQVHSNSTSVANH